MKQVWADGKRKTETEELLAAAELEGTRYVLAEPLGQLAERFLTVASPALGLLRLVAKHGLKVL